MCSKSTCVCNNAVRMPIIKCSFVFFDTLRPILKITYIRVPILLIILILALQYSLLWLLEIFRVVRALFFPINHHQYVSTLPRLALRPGDVWPDMSYASRNRHSNNRRINIYANREDERKRLHCHRGL